MENEKKENETNEKETKGIKAKGASLWGQIAAAVWVGGWNAAQFIQAIIKGVPINPLTIILSGLAIAACFTPVYFNLLMDKVKEIKLGGGNE